MTTSHDIKNQINACASFMIDIAINEDAIDFIDSCASIMRYCALMIAHLTIDDDAPMIDDELRDAIITMRPYIKITI